jgi:hypothetical protein
MAVREMDRANSSGMLKFGDASITRLLSSARAGASSIIFNKRQPPVLRHFCAWICRGFSENAPPPPTPPEAILFSPRYEK